MKQNLQPRSRQKSWTSLASRNRSRIPHSGEDRLLLHQSGRRSDRAAERRFECTAQRLDVVGNAHAAELYRSEEIFRGEIRCDLHPRWTPDGRGLTIDTVPVGDRQIHLIDVSDVVG